MEVAMGEVAGWVVVWVLTWIACRTIIAKTSSTKKRELPPGPKGWPVLGCLPVLGKMPHVTLTEMRDKYGPVVYLKLGTSGMVVANTPAAAKAFLKTLDLNFSNRPGNAGATLLAYDSQDMVWAPYGPRWTHLRKLSNLHMLGGKALEDFAPARESEVAAMLRSILSSAQNGETVVLPDLINVCAANIVGQIILKKRVFHQKGEESNEFKDMVVELMTTAGYFNIGDFIPSVAWLDLQGIQRGMKKLHKKWDALISKMITDHQTDKHKIKDETFLDILLAQKHVPEAQGRRLNDVHIKALLLNLFSAGTDTSSSVVEWTIAEAINNPEIMKKAHAELDKVVGRDRKVTTKDLDSLKYIRAMCKEGFRKHPSTPLSLPRVADEACDVGGYYIPKDTRLMVNIWGIGRDPAIWEKPEVYDPDRFLEGVGPHAKVDPRGNDFELIPFGAGRRICAGTRMGIAMVEFEVASLVHGFEWDVPSPAHRPMNMDEAFGLALQKAIPLEARATPRLPLHLY